MRSDRITPRAARTLSNMGALTRRIPSEQGKEQGILATSPDCDLSASWLGAGCLTDSSACKQFPVSLKTGNCFVRTGNLSAGSRNSSDWFADWSAAAFTNLAFTNFQCAVGAPHVNQPDCLRRRTKNWKARRSPVFTTL